MMVLASLFMFCRPREIPVATGVSTPPAELSLFEATVSFAKFENDTITHCIDAKMTGPRTRTDGAVISDEEATTFLATKWLHPKDMIRLPSTCREQVGDRPLFATCEISPPAIPKVTLWAKEYFLSFANVFNDDGAMRECLQMKGKWTPMSRKSLEFIDARMRFDQERAEKRMRKALKASGLDPARVGLDD